MKRLAVPLTILLLIIIASPANASELRIEPKNLKLQAIPGDKLVETILITNLSNYTKNLNIFWQTPKNYAVKFASIEKPALVIDPNTTIPIELEFNIPKEQQPADYYGSLVAKTNSVEEKSDFLITIPGTTKEEISSSDFRDSGSELKFTVKNTGNRAILLQTNARIETFFGLFHISCNAITQVKAGEQKEIFFHHSNLPPGFYQGDIVFLFGQSGNEHVFPSFWVNSDFILITTLLIVIAVLFYLKSRNSAKHG